MKHMNGSKALLGVLLLALALALPYPAWATYGINITDATAWLIAHQNADGSWGEPAVQFIDTVEAVQALRAAGYRNSNYERGLTWLENHAATNADYSARAALALGTNGDNVGATLTALQTAQNTALTGHSGWGVNAGYLQSPLDTALVLNTLSALGATANVSAAITYLAGSQLSNSGWPVGQESTSDPFTTAWVVTTLAPLQAQFPSLVTSTVLTNGVNALSSLVTASSPIYLQALAAHAALRANKPATTWLSNLVAAQGGNGSFASNQIYDTALAVHAFASADGLDSTANQALVTIPDANLRAAVNASLGRNAMDSLTALEMSRLNTLTAPSSGISDLTGLNFAANLAYLDLRNNNISSTSALTGLTKLTTANTLLAGNPVTGGGAVLANGGIPTLPEWGALLMALLLVGIAAKGRGNESRHRGLSA